jgi:hypothetical protein
MPVRRTVRRPVAKSGGNIPDRGPSRVLQRGRSKRHTTPSELKTVPDISRDEAMAIARRRAARARQEEMAAAAREAERIAEINAARRDRAISNVQADADILTTDYWLSRNDGGIAKKTRIY